MRTIRQNFFALLFTSCLTLLLALPLFAASPPNLTTNIKWDEEPNTAGNQQTFTDVGDIAAAFNNARRQEESQLGLATGTLGNLTMPSQTTWDSYDDNQKAFYLINDERVARADGWSGVIGLPLEGVETNISGIAQAFAEFLITTNQFGHQPASPNSPAGTTPPDRIDNDPEIGIKGAGPTDDCHEFLARSENIAAFWTSGNSIPLAVERAVYNWIYDDASSSWGHREAVLLQDTDLTNNNATYGYKNNYGDAGSEGFMGIGRSGAVGYDPFNGGYHYGEVVILNIFDPSPNAGCNYTIPLSQSMAPEILVTGNGVEISSGDVTPTVADQSDFGSTDIAGGTVVRTFTINNTGDALLTLSGSPLVAVSGTHAGDFSVTTLPANSVASSGNTTFQVTFNPSAAGIRLATISIPNNDSDENLYSFAIQGSGFAKINSSITQQSVNASYSSTLQSCPATGSNLAIHSITPTLRNSSSSTYSDLFFRVRTLEYTTAQGGNAPSLCNATTVVANGSVGSLLAISNSALPGSDNEFDPNDNLVQTFQVGLTTRARFRIFVDLFTNAFVSAGAQGANSNEAYVGTFAYTIDPAEGGATQIQEIYLPMISRQ